jgi:hypothetical protein
VGTGQLTNVSELQAGTCLLWRPAELVTVRFGPVPSSRDRIDAND